MDKKLGFVEYNFDIICQAKQFECGNKTLDENLYDEDKCSKNVKTFLYIDFGTMEIIGYYTICASAISLIDGLETATQDAYKELKDLGRSMLIKHKGAFGIKFFAINKKYQGQYTRLGNNEYKYSKILMINLMDNLKKVSRTLGTDIVVLHSTDMGRKFYLDNGFEFLNYRDRKLYEETKSITGKHITKEEKERDLKYILNINCCEIGSFPMIIKI